MARQLLQDRDRVPDDKTGVTPIFKSIAILNEAKTRELGRKFFDDWDVVEIRFAGSPNYSVHPATGFSHWEVDDESGEQVQVSYAERWPRQYRQFRSKETQTKSGTPIDLAPFLTEGQKAGLKAMQVYTLEALAHLDGQELKNVGQGGREWKNQAIDYIERGSNEAIIGQQRAEIDDLKAKLQVAEDNARYAQNAKRPKSKGILDPDIIKSRAPPKDPDDPEDDEEDEDDEEEVRALSDDDDGPAEAAEGVEEEDFGQMTVPQLKRHIQSVTGHRPVGNPSHRTLVQMAGMAARQR
jgi:hypothetical protein